MASVVTVRMVRKPSLQPATKLRKGNVFTPVCQSFCSQDRDPPPDIDIPQTDTPQTETLPGQRHPPDRDPVDRDPSLDRDPPPVR